MSIVRGKYTPPDIRRFIGFLTPKLVVPMADRNGGMADAIYAYDGREADGVNTRYKLENVVEWMPPVCPSNALFTSTQRLPAMINGTLDVTAEAALRGQEWEEYERSR